MFALCVFVRWIAINVLKLCETAAKQPVTERTEIGKNQLSSNKNGLIFSFTLGLALGRAALPIPLGSVRSLMPLHQFAGVARPFVFSAGLDGTAGKAMSCIIYVGMSASEQA